MQITSAQFSAQARAALANAGLQRAMAQSRPHFRGKRAEAVAALPEFEALREAGRQIKDHTLEHLDFYLEQFAEKVAQSGGQVHWCPTAADARDAVLKICQNAGARRVTKSKSMITEEIALNAHLLAHGIQPVETDLGEYIIQLRDEPPSHIIAPALHLNLSDWQDSFRAAHTDLPEDRALGSRGDILAEARGRLREAFLAADIGITGANFLIAETGSSVTITNEGNAELTQTLPRVHVVVASIEKIAPTLEDAATLIRLLARSASGQDMSVYTSFATGPRRAEDPDGPAEFHVVLLDAGRSAMLGSEFQDMLRCIRCGACMNHCPVYGAVGGHAYGWTYPGPMGSVLTPALAGLADSDDLPNASTLCGACEAVCPVKIPLPDLLRHWRERAFARRLAPPAQRRYLAIWAWLARRPDAYRLATRMAAHLLHLLGGASGRITGLPLAGGWTAGRDLPAPEGDTFFARHARAERAARRPAP